MGRNGQLTQDRVDVDSQESHQLGRQSNLRVLKLPAEFAEDADRLVKAAVTLLLGGPTNEEVISEDVLGIPAFRKIEEMSEEMALAQAGKGEPPNCAKLLTRSS